MLSFQQLRQVQLGGFMDTAALLAIAAGGMATHPVLGVGSLPIGIGVGAGLSAVGGGWIGRRVSEALSVPTLEGSSLRINSSEPPPLPPGDPGVHLGFIVDSGAPLIIPTEDWTRHAMLPGSSGIGKTVMGTWLMAQQIAKGGGMTWIDGKLDPENLRMLYAMCCWAGRQDDLLVLNPGDPSMSNTFNLVLDGDPDEVAARLLSVLPPTESNPGADFYRNEANVGLMTMLAAIQATGLAYNCGDLGALLTNQKALQWLEQRVPHGTDAQRNFTLFLERFKAPARPGEEAKIDIKKLKDVFGGIGGRLAMFGAANFGAIGNTYTPDINLTEAVRQNKIIYLMLPTMGKQEVALNYAKTFIGAFRTTIAQIQALPKHQRPNPPHLGFFDEAGSYVTMAWARMFEQSRAARLVMCPAFQSKANLEAVGEELRDMVVGSTATQIFFRPNDNNTADWMAELVGKERQTEYSVSASHGRGASKRAAVSDSPDGVSDTGSASFSETVKEDYKVSASDFYQLRKGEAIVKFDGNRVYHIRTPLLSFDPAFMDKIGDPVINRRKHKPRKGVDVLKNSHKFIGAGESLP